MLFRFPITNIQLLVELLATIDLRVDYLKSAEAKTIIVEGETVKLSNRILVVKMKVYQNDLLIAEGKGVYNLLRIKNIK